MAEFLNTTGISYRLEEIINNANERLVIISPYLKINERIKELLEDRDRMTIDIRLVYGKSELQPEENNWLESTSIRTRFLQNLHAKCYLNENEALLTSMNLYEFSQQHNYEMGIVVSRERDTELYGKVNDEVQRIMRASEEIRVTVARVETADDDKAEGPKTEAPRARQTPENGFCIRCKGDLPVNPAQPYCRSCYGSWRRNGKNKTHEEGHCHTCGSEHAATLLKPVCRSCYRKYKDVLEFAA